MKKYGKVLRTCLSMVILITMLTQQLSSSIAFAGELIEWEPLEELSDEAVMLSEEEAGEAVILDEIDPAEEAAEEPKEEEAPKAEKKPRAKKAAKAEEAAE